MPVHRGQQDLQEWPHLKHVQIAEIESDIDQLIGTNVPKALESLQVICNENNGPYCSQDHAGLDCEWTA